MVRFSIGFRQSFQSALWSGLFSFRLSDHHDLCVTGGVLVLAVRDFNQ